MTQLQRVTKEQAGKLKNLGFGWECDSYYYLGNPSPAITCFDNWNKYTNTTSAVQLDLCCKWLRDVKGVHVNTLSIWHITYKKYVYVFNVSYPNGRHYDDGLEEEVLYDTYESAQSAGLDVALDYLIDNLSKVETYID